MRKHLFVDERRPDCVLWYKHRERPPVFELERRGDARLKWWGLQGQQAYVWERQCDKISHAQRIRVLQDGGSHSGETGEILQTNKNQWCKVYLDSGKSHWFHVSELIDEASEEEKRFQEEEHWQEAWEEGQILKAVSKVANAPKAARRWQVKRAPGADLKESESPGGSAKHSENEDASTASSRKVSETPTCVPGEKPQSPSTRVSTEQYALRLGTTASPTATTEAREAAAPGRPPPSAPPLLAPPPGLEDSSLWCPERCRLQIF